MRILMKFSDRKRITRGMAKKDKQMEKPGDKWKTVGIEARLLTELQKEADREKRSATQMLGLILEERYAPK